MLFLFVFCCVVVVVVAIVPVLSARVCAVVCNPIVRNVNQPTVKSEMKEKKQHACKGKKEQHYKNKSNDYVVLHIYACVCSMIEPKKRRMRFNCVTRDRIDMHYCDASQNNDINHNLYKRTYALFHTPIRISLSLSLYFSFFFDSFTLLVLIRRATIR